jgi:NADH dehydrogenase [ubiquinone] 1 alpha subcomplex assembly factor 7
VSRLGEALARRIQAVGPITVADYMAAALADPDDGYYAAGSGPLGAAGDFVTAPEISQLFGELIGAWLVDCWDRLGRPAPFRLVELGPGRGTLMADALRVAAGASGWADSFALELVEINPHLRALQLAALGRYRPVWRPTLDEVPDGPMLLVANEFLDALPIRQLVFWNGAWRERLIGWRADSGFYYRPAPTASALAMLVPPALKPWQGAIFEFSPAAVAIADATARRIVANGGAAVFIDYGRAQPAFGDTLQAVSRHRYAPVLMNPGSADLSAHVDFGQIVRAAGEAGARVAGPVTQGDFLNTLGIGIRADALKRAASAHQSLSIDAARNRLTDPSDMGGLFKAVAMSSPNLSPAGFSDCA